eukprot:SAG11_NODE_11900_length_732_cov_2.097946_1_plen_45_part_01
MYIPVTALFFLFHSSIFLRRFQDQPILIFSLFLVTASGSGPKIIY